MSTEAETQAALDQAQHDFEAAKAAHDAAVAASAGPRAPDVIIFDLLEAIVMHGGNHPKQRALLKELKAVTAAPAT